MTLRPVVTALLAALLLLTSCTALPVSAPAAEAQPAADSAAADSAAADIDGIKSYLVEQTAKLSAATADLQQIAGDYYTLAEQSGFDYAALWAADPAAAIALVEGARAAWMTASPLYEQVEGIVAGTPSLAHYDVDLDAGSSAEEDPAGAVSFDITLPSGAVLAQPGNLFGVTESTLWGTFAPWRAAIDADFDADGAVEFGEALPDADVLKGSADLLAQMTSDLQASAAEWQPTLSDAFTALVVMVPTMSEYFASWRDSRFVSGDASTQRDFVAISRLADIIGILGGLEIVYAEVQPLAAEANAEQATLIADNMAGLKQYVADILAQEQQGTRFTAEEADQYGAEAQDRATAITGLIAQIAGRLEIPIEE